MLEASAHHNPSVHHHPWWGQPALWLGGWLLLLIYGSMMPFDFAVAQRWAQAESHWLLFTWDLLTSPGFVDPALYRPTSSLGMLNTTSDVLLNALLYVPLGLLLRVAIRERVACRRRQVVWALLGVALMSYSMECLQSLTLQRWATVSDLMTNISGGALGVLLAPWMARNTRQVLFAVYCRAARLRYALSDAWGALVRRPAVLFSFWMLCVGLVVVWYASVLSQQPKMVAAMPFLGYFERSYDVAAVLLGRSLVVYVLLAMLLSLQFLRRAAREGFAKVVLGVALLGALLEGMRLWWGAEGAAARVDMTEPIIAAMAGAMLVYLAYVFGFAVRVSCRRREQQPVAHDRRRRPHEYAGATPAHENQITQPTA